MDTYRMREMSNDYRKNALLGTWCKTGRGEYTRMTGEVVKKVGSAWVVGDYQFGGLAHAMQHIDSKYRN